jgi:hypothetical protein
MMTKQLRLFLRQIGREAYFGARRIANPWRAWPKFMIIGTQKGGTTSLFHYLTQHPQIRAGFRKEIHYFDGGPAYLGDTYARGPGWYHARFPLQLGSGRQWITGDASPSYMFHPLAAARIKAELPQTKLIILLRNPVARAISHYFLEQRRQTEPLAMMAAFQQEEGRLAACLAAHDYKDPAWHCHSYLARGRYHEQLVRFFDLFPREQFLILPSEQLFAQPLATVTRCLQFLGLPVDGFSPSLEVVNSGSNKSPVAPEVTAYLTDYFAPHNEKLWDLLGERYPW